MFDKIKYDNEYNQNNYDRFPLMVKKGKKNTLKDYAATLNISLNKLIKLAVTEFVKNHFNDDIDL